MSTRYRDFYSDIMSNGVSKSRPVAGMFELTGRCNFQCKMCYICGSEEHQDLMKRELTAEQWIELGRQARDAGCLFLTLTGGEIFIRKDFWQIYDALSKMGFLITLFTNGSLLTDDMISRLAKQPPIEISISLYGASSETYGNINGHPEAYEKVKENIHKLVDAGINVHLKTPIIKYTSTDYLQMREFARLFNKPLDIVNYISPRREGTGSDPLANRLSPTELMDFIFNVFRTKIPDEQKPSVDNDTTDKTVSDIMLDESTQKFKDLVSELPSGKKSAFKCAAGRCSSWLSWEGKLFPCGLMTDISADPLTIGFENAWREVIKKCSEIPVCEECESCVHYKNCGTCPARRKLETGEHTKVPKYLCDVKEAEKLQRESLSVK